MPDWPSEIVTFLCTNLEGEGNENSLEPKSGAKGGYWARFNDLFIAGVSRHGGTVARGWHFDECTFAFFPQAQDAVNAASFLQEVFRYEDSPDSEPFRLTMALHTGTAGFKNSAYGGETLTRCVYLRDLAHPGQVIVSETTVQAARFNRESGASLLDLGLHLLKDLGRPEKLFQLVHPDLPSEFPALRSLDSFRHNLSLPLTSFIGREREIAEIRSVLGSASLLTLAGVGGCGKTRLAIQAAASMIERFPDGAWLVELAPLESPSLVPHTVAKAIGIREESGGDLVDKICAHLRHSETLLVLDNCEHLIGSCASLVEKLLSLCPILRVIVTSREPLGVPGEVILRVPPLTLPDVLSPSLEDVTQYDAIRLFVERARSVRRGYEVDEQQVKAIVEVCKRLDGVPLAIELAAARIGSLTLEQIQERLDDRFRLLTRGSRTALPRQQTLRALVDWSYDLLAEPEQMLLRRLSIFVGEFSLEASEGICQGDGVDEEDILEILSELVSKSLVNLEEKDRRSQFRLLETIRQYGQEKLHDSGEYEDFRVRHRDWYLSEIELTGLQLTGSQFVSWLNKVQSLYNNLLLALERSILDSEAEAAMRIAVAFAPFWDARGYLSEGRRWLERTLAIDDDSHLHVRTDVIYWIGSFAVEQRDYAEAGHLLQTALDLFKQIDVPHKVADTLDAIGAIHYEQGDHEAAAGYVQESLAIWREQENSVFHNLPRQGIATALVHLGLLAINRGDYDEARKLTEEAHVIAAKADDYWTLADALTNLGKIARDRGEFQEAFLKFQEALVAYREVGDHHSVIIALRDLGNLLLFQENNEGARGFFEEALEVGKTLGDRLIIADNLRSLGNVAMCEQKLEQARTLFEQSRDLYAGEGSSLGLGRISELMGNLAIAQNSYETAQALYAESEEYYFITDSQDNIATSVTNQAIAAHLMGDHKQAGQKYRKSLELWNSLPSSNKFGIVVCLEGLAKVLALFGQPRRAPVLFSLAEILMESEVYPANISSWFLYSRIRAENKAFLSAIRREVGDEDFEQAWLEGRTMNAKAVVMALLSEAATIGGPSKSPVDSIKYYPDGLSNREVEVLRLIASGKSNRLIAEELFISPNTVANHITNILNKTNAVNRTGAATYAAQHGLL